VYVPAVVGVPLKTPLELSDIPGGRAPLVTLQVRGILPDAYNVDEYGELTAPSERGDVLNIAGALAPPKVPIQISATPVAP
jgi:hypothetical protein